jgi:hypothetical protein
MDHRLFIAGQVVTEIRILLQRLSDTRHVSMSEDAPYAGEKRALVSVALNVLILEKRDQRLSCG